ncbi:OstA family protein [Sphingomonas changnyeongensis]|uniref:OstA family protein n=2 Tax=Sphingomonas changnyeongensis TaxID=2698679 RepID=A0A7Z2S9G4_9SPHN|nr:LptA/OstA family protein [Sphingomonas changnyeongensis]QHL91752.1 OstA family protein [Sphingomonas changnyeongensis]
MFARIRAMPALAAMLALAGPAAAQALRGHNTAAPVDVEADRIEVQDRADRAVFAGNVRVRQGDLALDAARLTIAYDRQGGDGLQIERLDAAGGVTLRSPSETARGQYAIYDLNRRQITMVGGVTLNQGANVIRGGRLVIDLNSGRASMDGAAAPGTTTGRGGRVTGRFTVPQRQDGTGERR